jgi:zinc D-Ala-D-Ala carboxypeptidase
MEMLSPHFSLDELTVSETAARMGWDNIPSPKALANLRSLASTLELIRYAVCAPLIITSGYRSSRVNAAVGGRVGSQHTIGCAADFICPGFSEPLGLAHSIHRSGIPFDQLIHEFGRWVHVSVVPIESRSKPRGQVLTIDRLGTRPGLLKVREVRT